ncbi:MAG: Cys-Gln thioester bond-forming surface protein [Erysipelotrichaceae bacterium]|nr:Cys-Gln thioester bond-forming surface protein [Erysipelotrichaceae bacterium]
MKYIRIVILCLLMAFMNLTTVSAAENKYAKNARPYITEPVNAKSDFSVTNIRTAWYVYPNSNPNNFNSFTDMGLVKYRGDVAYCIQPLELVVTSATYSEIEWNGYPSLSDSKKELIQLYMNYGYDYPGHKTNDYYLATQKLIWETMGYTVKYYSDTAFTKSYSVSEEAKEIKRLTENHGKTISIPDDELFLHQQDEITLTDRNKVLQDYTVKSAPEGVTVTIDKNTLTVTADKPVKGTIVLQHGIDQDLSLQTHVIKSSYSQNMATYQNGTLPPLRYELPVNVVGKGDAKIRKTDTFTGKPLAGVTFRIADNEKMENAEEYTTDENGEIRLEDVWATPYYIQETKTIDGYVSDDTVRTFTVTENETVTVKITNMPHTADYTIHKSIELDERYLLQVNDLSGFTFTVHRLDETQDDMEMTTDETGTCTLTLPLGTYEVRETPKPGYLAKDPWTITITENTEEEVYNEIRKVRLQVQKIDADTKLPIPLTCSFTLKDSNGNYVLASDGSATHVSDDTGVVVIDDLFPGEYILEEIKAPDGYLLSTTPQTILLDGTQSVVSVFFTNKALHGQIAVIKTGDVCTSLKKEDTPYGTLYTPVFEPKPLQGVTYELRAHKDIIGKEGTVHYRKDEVIATKTTDDNGELIFTDLPLGSYELEETDAPDGYEIDSEITVVTLRQKDETRTIVKDKESFFNKWRIPDVTVYKNHEPSFFISEEEAQKDVVLGLFTAKDCELFGFTIPKDSLIAYGGTSDNSFTAPLPFEGEFYVKELACHPSFALSGQTLTITYENGLVHIPHKTLQNGLKRYSAAVYKYDERSKKALENACFGIFISGKEKPLQTSCSDSSGIARFTELELGTYELEELSAPEGYQLHTQRQTITVTENEDINVLNFPNSRVVPTADPYPNVLGLLAIFPLAGLLLLKKRL